MVGWSICARYFDSLVFIIFVFYADKAAFSMSPNSALTWAKFLRARARMGSEAFFKCPAMLLTSRFLSSGESTLRQKLSTWEKLSSSPVSFRWTSPLKLNLDWTADGHSWGPSKLLGK